MSVARAVVLVAVAGCNQLYGLDETQLGPEVPVTGRLVYRWVENDSAGMPVAKEGPLDASFTVYLGARVGRSIQELALDAGAFSFTRSSESEPYQLVLTIEGEIIEIHHDAPELVFVVRAAGRADVKPITDPLKITFPQLAGTERAAIASTGIWAYAEKGAFGGNYEFDWQAIDRVDRPGLLDAGRNDVFYYFDFARRMTPENESYLTIAGATSMPLTMTAMPLAFAAPPRVTGAPCTTLVGAHAADVARFQAATPGFFFIFDRWRVMAVPDPALGSAGSIDLAFGESFGPMGDITATPSIFNPIKHSRLAMNMTSTVRRYIQHPNASLGDPIDSYLVHTAPLACTSPTANIIAPPIGIPGGVALDGTPLTADTVEVASASGRDLELTWTSVSPGRTDWYSVVLYEVFEISNFTGRRATRTFQTATPRLALDPANLVRGRYYIVEISAFAGLPEAARGDLDTLTYPFSGALTYSSMFRVR